MRHFAERLAPALLGLAMILALAVAAHAQGPGILEGQVVNGTAGGPDIGAGIPVMLLVLQGDTKLDALETSTGADGSFRFEGLDTDASLEYWPEVVYLEVPYSGAEPYRFDGGETTLVTTITVYETTDDDSTIGLDSVHLIAESFGEMLRVSEIHLVGNSGDRTYIGRAAESGQSTTVSILLPENAVGVAFEQDTSGERFVEAEAGVLDTEPVPPGQETSLVFFSYHLPVTGETIPLERRFAYPVSTLSALVAQPDLTLRSDQLEARGPESFQGRQYEFYVSQDLASGAPLVMELVPQTDVTSAQSTESTSAEGAESLPDVAAGGNQGFLRWFGLGLVGLAVIGAVVYSLASRQPASGPASAPDLAADPKAQKLLAELADLEDAFEAGQVDEAAYERRRAEIYEMIKSL